MKKHRLFFGFAALFLAAIFTLVGCNDGGGEETKTLSSIAITTQPTKTTYIVGESLNTAGMVVTATYSDGSTAAVTGWTTSPANSAALTTAGNQSVTVSYKEGDLTKTATFTVTITAAGSGGEDTSQVATPTASPAAGAVPSGTEISLSTATAGADIYYTTNGSTPSKSSAKYTSKIPITSAITIKAIAVKDGMTDSDVLTADYTLSGSETVPVSSVSLDKTTLTLTVGNTEILTPTVAPDTATNKTVSWSSSNLSVASVSNGTVSAIAVGTATITVSTADGAKTATCAVTVTAAGGGDEPGSTPGGGSETVPVSGVSLDKPTLTLTVSGTGTLIATVLPNNATNKTVSWSSSNLSVASVSNGTISAVAVGTATITVKTVDGNKTATCLVTVTTATSGSGSVTITPPSEDPVLDAPAAESADGYTSDFTITASTGYQSYTWLLDGVVVQTGSGNTFRVPGSRLAKGSHSVTVIAAKGRETYSATKDFKVK